MRPATQMLSYKALPRLAPLIGGDIIALAQRFKLALHKLVCLRKASPRLYHARTVAAKAYTFTN